MNVKILSIHEQGNAEKEYVLLEVVEDCDLGHYGLADTTYTSDGAISNKLRHFFWFPDTDVKKGERIVLRTGIGTNDEYTTNSGKKVHRFFWGLRSAVWNNEGDAAVLFEIKTWKATRA
jgi:hypothetical protein